MDTKVLKQTNKKMESPAQRVEDSTHTGLDTRLGTAHLSPDGPVVAGSMMQWTLTYTAGSYGVDEGGLLMLVQRIAADIQKPQFEFPDQPAYTSIIANANCRLSYRFQPKQYKRPWQKWCLVIDVKDGYLEPGDTITIILGDQSKGSPGIRAQSFIESAHEFRVLIDPTNAAQPRRLPSSPAFPVVADKPIDLACLMPSQILIGETREIFVDGIDRWGNPTLCPDDLILKLIGNGNAVIENKKLKAISAGTVYVEASGGGMTCRSNPIQIVWKKPNFMRYWGDLHAQTDSTVGTGTEEEYFTFARNSARLDFSCHQGNDFQLNDEDWQRVNHAVKKHHQSEEFVVFPGYEWSGNTSAGGDHNVIFLKDDPPIYRSSHWQVSEVPEDDMTPAHPVDNLFEKLKKHGDAMVIPHVGGRHADVGKYFDPEIEHVVEILSCHGLFEWLLWDSLEQGYKVGIVCNSDGHKGRPGAESPGAGMFGISGGLTCILAKELTRTALFEALKSRRCYGTTGARMILEFEANGSVMGEELETDNEVAIKAAVQGTTPIEALILMCGKEVIHVERPPAFKNILHSPRIRISWGGARIRGRARRATWDGKIKSLGTRILSAATFAFDSPADGIVAQNETEVTFKSSTTGDVDGIDLRLENPNEGSIHFLSAVGEAKFDLAELGNDPVEISFGGLDLRVQIQRYPEHLEDTSLTLEKTIRPPAGKISPYLVKAVQEDGQAAWASPIFVTCKDE